MDSPPRPWSPSVLHDVVVPAHPRPSNLPPPPSGHDLMRMFPAPSPATRPPAPGSPRGLPAPTPTSGWFERQEHAFFAKAGKEIVRVRKEGESNGGSNVAMKSPTSAGPMPFAAYQNHVPPPQHALPPPLPQSLPYPPGPHPNAIPHPLPVSPHQQQHSQQQRPDAPMASLHSSPPSAHSGYPAQGQRMSPSTKPIQPIVLTPSGVPSASGPPNTSQHYREHTVHHHNTHPHPAHHPHSHSAHSSVSSHPSPPASHSHSRSPASSSSTTDRDMRDAPAAAPQQIPEPYDPSDPNEAWRRPMPHAERRRAGKHTRRVVVKS